MKKEDIPDSINILLGIAGICIGAVIGCYALYWFARQGFYAAAIPGFFCGLSARLLSQKPSRVIPLISGILAVPVGLYADWSIKVYSFTYYFTHLHLLNSVTWILLLIGAFLAYHFAKKPISPQPYIPQPAQEPAPSNSPDEQNRGE